MIKATVNLGLEDEDGRIEIEPPEFDEFFDASDGPTVVFAIFDNNNNDITATLDGENFHKLVMMLRRIDEDWTYVNRKIHDIRNMLTTTTKVVYDARK